MSANKHVLICVLWAFSTFGIFAQNYPIQTTVQLLPPYTPRLTELQSEPNRLSVSLLNKDLATPVVEVYLSLRLQGPGVGLQTRPGFRPLKTFTLNAGVPISINGPDLAELLQPQNLDFQGLDRNAFIRGGQLLPEGLWTISISAYSVARNLQVSNTGVVMAGLFKHKPPLLNFPFHESRAGSALPQFLPFQWTSRHYASPFAAGSIRYRFKMIELIPGSRNPNEAMQATAIPWFETFTDQTSYIYGPADPPLVPGRSYAWQVQAIDVDGSEGFENEGYSQVFSFVFGETCAAPLGIRARAEEGRTIRVSWTPIPGIASAAYSLWYRTKGIGEWQTFMVTDTVATVGGLLPNTEYEVYVNRICLGGESPPTATITVMTDALRGAWDEVSKQCGKPAPTFDLSNRKPLQALEPGETFTAADFTIKVLSATGENGEFSGSGTVWLPFTGKVPIPCTWEHVSINSDRRLVDGMVKILRKPLVLSNLTFEKLADRWRDLFGSNWNRSEYKRMAVPVSGVEVLPDGRIRIRTAKGDEFARGGQNTVIEGPDGKRWYVSAGGKVTGPEGPAEKPVVGNESNGSGTPGSVLPDGTMVLFDNDDPNRRAWDAYNIRSETGGSSYDRLDGPPGGYVAGWKLLATGEKETVRATLRKGKLKLHPDSIRFLRSDGVRVKSERLNDTVWKLEVPGRLHLWADAVWAVGSIVPPDSVRGGARRVLGKLNLIAADERKVHVKLVPVGSSGGTISKGQLETALNVITAKFGVKTGVEVMPSMAVSGYNPQVDKISVNRMVLKTSYGTDLQRFIREYEVKYRSPRSDTAVMFLLGPAADQTEGYMALNNRHGFIFCGNSPPDAHTLAHELGHGLLVLEHPFEESAEQVGKTLNLMDYRKPHALTHFKQWKRIHDKEEVGNFLQSIRQKELEGKMIDWTLYRLDQLGLPKGKGLYHSFITPNGKVIALASDSLDGVTFSRSFIHTGTHQLYYPNAGKANGALTAFIYAGKKYGAYLKGKWFRGFYSKETNTTRRFDSGWVMRKTGSAKEQVVAGVEIQACQLRVYQAGFSALTTDTCPREFKLTDSSLLSSHSVGNSCYEYFDEKSLTIYAKRFWDSAQLNPNYRTNVDLVRRVVRLINDYGDEYPFYDIRNYNRFIEKYRPKFSLPELSPTIPFKTASLQTYENYLRLHLGVLVNIKAAFDEVKTYSELCELLAVLPDNYYPKLTFQQRLNSLKILATEGLAVVSWRGWLENGGTEGIALKLLFTTPESERSKMLDSLVAGPAINGRVHLLAALCADISGLDGDNFNRFIGDITRWIFEYRQSAEENLVKSVAEGRYVIFDPDFWGDGIQYKFDSKGDIVFLIFKKSSQKVLREYHHPYDWINIQFTSATQYLGKPIPKGSTLRLPALFVYGVFNHIDRDRMGTAFETTLDIALMAVGVGEVAMALKAANGIRKAYLVTKSIVDLTAGMGDLVVSNVLAEKLNETDAGREFLNSWNTFQLYYGLGSLGLSGGEALVKQLRKQGDDLTQTAGNLSRTEKDEVEKIVADVERKVSGAGKMAQYAGKTTKGVKNLLSLESPTGLFRQLKGTNGQTYRAATFWTDESADFMHYVSKDAKYYIKHDPTNGRVLFIDAENNKFVGFMLDQDNIINNNYSTLLENLKTIHGMPNSIRTVNIKGTSITFADDKVNLVLGKYKPNSSPGISGEIGTDDVIEQLLILKNYSFADKSFELRNGSVHVLNIPDGMYNPVTFFDDFNKEMLDLAVNNPTKVKITFISDARKESLLSYYDIVKNIRKPTGFGMEIKYLRGNAIKQAYLKDGTSLNLDNINLDNIDWSAWKY